MLTAAFRERGLDDRDLLRLQRQGELTRIRRGAYASDVRPSRSSSLISTAG